MNLKNDETLKMTPQTITSTLMLFLSIANYICKILGFYPLEIDQSQLFDFVTNAWVICSIAYSYWHNNSWSKKAKIGDIVKDLISDYGDVDLDRYDIEVNIIPKETRSDDQIEGQISFFDEQNKNVDTEKENISYLMKRKEGLK